MLSAASSSRPGLRRGLVLWLYAAGAGHLLAGLLLTWADHQALFNDYLASIEQAFWGAAAPAPARAQQVWWLGLFGATLQSYALYLLALVYLGDRLRAPAAWAWLMVGIVLWAPQDMWLSWQVGMSSHLWIDSFALLVLLPPLAWLYRHDRLTSRSLS
ncbi:hypothetical protein I9018_21560 [Pseudomonas sp. MPFS]|uniref:hypothetical protein n=1 Tax=Pseudomonas sp. MPFS TaxID=2795724 RepID=UPI001F144EEC|nr:hypothetical protein [Pseudomonas sp. MPFS]UMZ10073.1 hypothetical protein I9018_21560 [Pseudomonas sp. MPFS]